MDIPPPPPPPLDGFSTKIPTSNLMDQPPPPSSNLTAAPAPSSNLIDDPGNSPQQTQVPQGESWKRAWTLQELRAGSEKWTLAADSGVNYYIYIL